MKQTRTAMRQEREKTVDLKNSMRNSLLSQMALTQIENTHSLLKNVKDVLMNLVSPNLDVTIGDLCDTICSVQEHIVQMHNTLRLMRETYARCAKEGEKNA